MKKQDLIDANEWFKVHNIQSFIHRNNTLYVVVDYDFELQLSNAETLYRAEEFRRLKEQDLIK